jgi:thiol:disulfide interchange protein
MIKYLKKLYIPIFLFFIYSLKSSLEIKWNDVVHDADSGTITIGCSYQTHGTYILAESMQAVSFPLRQYVSIMFDQQPHELFVPHASFPLLVLYGEGDLTFVIPSPDAPVEKITLFYKIYDTKLRAESDTLSLDILPNVVSKSDENTTIVHENKENKSCDLSINNNDDDACHDSEDFDEENEEINNLKDSLSFIDKIIYFIQTHPNNILVFVLLFFIGLIMSFTPCMYPMIPITLGILGVHKNEKFKKILLKSTAYIFGMATVFSILGVIAASGGMIFGGLLTNKYFVLVVCFGLFYMSGGMLDLYELKLPAFNFGNYNSSSSVIIGPFIYGMITGTISSPCVTPALFTLLTLVSEFGNLFLGGIYLFMFGLGMGFPLWVASIVFKRYEQLPSAGAWMVSVKKIIGIAMVFVSYKYLSLLLSPIYCYIIIGSILLVVINNFYKDYEVFSFKAYKIHSFILIISLLSSFLFVLFKIGSQFYAKSHKIDYFLNSFNDALEKAKKEKKYLLLDFTADWCSLCQELEKKHFKNQKFWNDLSSYIIPVKIDCTSWDDSAVQVFIEQYDIKGLPTILLINPFNKEIVATYDSKVNELTSFDFSEKIRLSCISL